MATILKAGNVASGAQITSDATGILEIKTGTGAGTTALTVDTSQNVGVGTSSPFQRFEVRGGQAQFSNGGDFYINSTGTAVNLYGANNVPMIFSTNAAERARITSGGHFCVGTTAAAETAFQATFYGSVNGGFNLQNSTNFTSISVSGNDLFLDVGRGGTAGAAIFRRSSSNTESARINSDGNMMVGTTTARGRLTLEGAGDLLTGYTTGTNTGYVYNSTSATVSNAAYFVKAGTEAGKITVVANSTTYATSSDYRLKENIEPITGALAKVDALKPCTYTWKNTGEASEGFIAHELAEVCPQAVVGEKDAVYEDGSINPQGIDTSFLIATLTAAIQELNAKVEAQAAEIAALKGA